MKSPRVLVPHAKRIISGIFALLESCARGIEAGESLDQAELGQGGHAIVEADLLDDFAVDHLQHGRAGKVHLAACRRGESADEEILEGRTRMSATALPL